MKKPKTAISSGSHWLGTYLPRDGGLLLKSTLRSRLYCRVPGVLKKAQLYPPPSPWEEGGRPAHMHRKTSAQPQRKGALTAGLPLHSEAELQASESLYWRRQGVPLRLLLLQRHVGLEVQEPSSFFVQMIP
ncbi:unnamed protein product [Sphagnum jensenii]|uniref:Uncharacterized protein n=1 Tax=Sphagnum jensenii TaxID=128206 RepID=A0ABP1ABT7_9BRYO